MSWKPTGTPIASRATSVGIALLFLISGLALVPGASAAAPTVSSIETVDADGNGFLDAFKVTVTGGDTGDTVDLSKYKGGGVWAIAGFSVVDVIAGGGTARANHANTYTAAANVFYIVVNEAKAGATDDPRLKPTNHGGAGNTDATPTVTYTQPTPPDLVDDDGEAIAFAAAATTDKAKPVLMEAKGTVNSPTVTLTFSEEVDGSGTTPAGSFVVADITETGVFEIDSIAGGSSRTVTVTLKQNVVRTDACGAQFAPAATVKDEASTPLTADSRAMRLWASDAPCIWAATSDPNTNIVTLYPTETVQSGGSAVSASDITYNTGSGGPTMTAATSTAVTLSSKIGATDIDADTVAFKTSVNKAGAPAFKASTEAVTVFDITRPTVSSRTTIDADGDGLIDEVHFTFTEPVEVTTASVDWKVMLATSAGAPPTWTCSDPDAGTPDYAPRANNVGEPTSVSFDTASNTVKLALIEDGTVGVDYDTDEIDMCVHFRGHDSIADKSGLLLPLDFTANAQGFLFDASSNQVTDGAAPVVKSAKTVDTATADGKLDQVEVTFSENIKFESGTGDDDDFAVDGLTVHDVTMPTISGAVLTVPLKGAPTDTSLAPETTYTAPSTSAGRIVDDIATTVNKVAGFTVTAADKAAPVLLRTVTYDDDAKRVDMVFSEDVKDATAADLAPADFTYTNGGGATQTISSVTHPADADDKVVALSLSHALTEADISGPDTVAAKTTVVDAVGNAAGTAAKNVGSLAMTYTTKDTDADGKLDQIEVRFGAAISDPGSGVFTATEWVITGLTGCAATCNPTFIDTGSVGDDRFITLHISEPTGTTVNSGETPSVEYTGTSLAYKQSGTAVAVQAATPAVDGAAPIIIEAKTQDQGHPAAVGSGKATNGLIDTYRLKFSENIATNGFSGWKVNGVAAIGADTAGGLAANELKVYFAESTGVGTGAVPEITYDGTHVVDTSAQSVKLGAVISSTIAETDAAAPVIIKASGEVDSDQVTVTFSEGVFGNVLDGSVYFEPNGLDDNNDGTVDNEVGDVCYEDVAASTKRKIKSVSHSGGSATATVTMASALSSSGDFGGDFFKVCSPGTSKLRDSINNPSAGSIASQRTITQASSADVTAPATITNVAVVTADTSSTTVKLTWSPPGDDGATGTVSSYEVKYHTSAINSANYASATTASVTFDPSVLLAGGSASAQTATVSGLTAGTTYFFAVKGVDEAGNSGGVSNSPSATTEATDSTAPADIGTVTTTTSANSVTLSFTAPGDDGSSADQVAKYVVKQSSSAISAAGFAAADAATFTATIVNGGATQTILITGLDQDTTYHFAIQAEDEVPNKNTVKSVGPVTTAKDTTAPTGTLSVTSATHTEGSGIANRNPTFSWTGLTDDESTITYHYKLDQTEGTTITAATTGTNSGSTTDTTVSFSNIATGTWFFHVAGESAGGFSATDTYEIVILETATVVSRATISAANADLRDSMDVSRDGGDNTVTWSLDGIDPEPSGVQVWRSTSPFSLIATLEGAAATAGEFVDEGASKSAVYLVTVFYTDDASGGKVDDLDLAPGYAGLSESEQKDLGTAAEDSSGMPWWGWLLIALGVLVIILIIVGIIIASRRGGGGGDNWSDDSWDDSGADTWEGGEESWDDGDDGWADSAPAAAPSNEAHELECPSCNHQFTAHGQKPLKTTCPSCGVKGVLN